MERYFERAADIEIEAINAFCAKKHFGNFYKIFLKAAYLYFKEKSKLLPDRGFSSVIDQLFERIEKIPVRVLIEEIHRQKAERKLRGENAREEYEYFQAVLLNDAAYIKKLCKEYPVMKELMLYQSCLFIENLCEIQKAISEDKEIIAAKLCNHKSFQKALNIQLHLSDPHRRGKTVAKVTLDNGCTIIYKPRSLQKEALFHKLCRVFTENSDLKFPHLKVVDRKDYGWEEFIEAKECGTEEEVKRYYERMGMLLFFCYLLGITDMHSENIIACGEYPVLIDLETMPGTVLKCPISTAEERVSKNIAHSVLRTGILPAAVWGKAGEGVILSALGTPAKMKTPFHLPYIEKPFTSEVHISYLKKYIQNKGSMPSLGGNIAGAAAYYGEICRGFETAYRLCMRLNAEITENLQAIYCQKGRFIIRHTQQYGMYQNISFYPQFLESWKSREDFFGNLKEHQKYPELYEYEKAALQEMDIPVFEADIENEIIYDGAGKAYCLGEFVIDKDFYQRNHLCEKDLQYQLKCIELSIDMLTKRRLPKLSCHDLERKPLNKERIVRNIADRLCDNAVIFEGDISWESSVYYDNQTWKPAPMGLDLYDGLGGIAIFLASVCRTCPEERYHKIFELLCKKLFAYTDGNGDSMEKRRTKDSGILKGEGSIVYMYLILYKITGKRRFLIYAEKHYAYFETLFLQCETTDYLSGDAGAIILLVKLFEKTNCRSYLETAVILGEKLWKKAKKMETGCSIEREDGLAPFAGMAHGASGYIMAYAYLLEALNEEKYYERIEKLLAYENSLFDLEAGNWRDLRKPKEQNQFTAAWCHGAPGIGLARMKLSGMKAFAGNQKIREDILRCARLLTQDIKSDSICLCHGLAGNYRIKNCLLEARGIDREKEKKKELREIMVRVESADGMLPREKYNFSFMTGLAGVGLMISDEKLCGEIFL